MLAQVGATSLEDLVAQVVPSTIIGGKRLHLPQAQSEVEALAELRTIAEEPDLQELHRGRGYVGTVTPGVILRNILENRPGTPPTRRTSPRFRRAGWRRC